MPRFKIVQLDSGVEYLLPIAKKYAQKQHAITPAFRKTWEVEGAGIAAHSQGDEIRLWISGGGQYSVGVLLPNPVPYRGVSIGAVGAAISRTAPQRSQYPTGSYSITQYTITPPGGYGGYQACIAYVYSTTNGVQTTVSSATFSNGVTAYNPDGSYNLSAAGRVSGHYAYAPESPTGVTERKYATNGIVVYELTGYSVWDGPTLANPITAAGDAAYAAALAAYNALQPDGFTTEVVASDGTVLASEVQNSSISPTHTKYVPDTAWKGEGSVGMYTDYVTPANLDHQLTFTVPPDCVYPVPTATDAAFIARRKSWNQANSDEFIAALGGGFQAGTVGVTHPPLQTGAIPAVEGYTIRTNTRNSGKTYMPVQPSASYVDTVLSDTSAGLTQAGTMVTQREVTYTYTSAPQPASTAITVGPGVTYTTANAGTDANNNPLVTVTYTQVIDGTLTQVVTQHTLNGNNVATRRQDTYAKWYAPGVLSVATPIVLPSDYTDSEVLWDGVVQQGYYADSTWGVPGSPLTYFGYSPTYPAYSNTLAGTIPALMQQYRSVISPKYDKTGAKVEYTWNDSALYGVTTIQAKLFGPVAADGTLLGLFADPGDADGATQVAIYGTATFKFDWKSGNLTCLSSKDPNTGALTWHSWSPKTDTNKNPRPKIVSLPGGISYKNSNGTLVFTGLTDPYGVAQPDIAAYNAAITYKYGGGKAMWPDVAHTVAADNKAAAATLKYATTGQSPLPTTPHVPFGDPVRQLVLSS